MFPKCDTDGKIYQVWYTKYGEKIMRWTYVYYVTDKTEAIKAVKKRFGRSISICAAKEIAAYR